MKIVKAVAPYRYEGKSNFKWYLYKAWREAGGQVAPSHYPPRAFHGLVYRWDVQWPWPSRTEARLRFVSGFSVRFDTFPDSTFYEVIPVVWDCWPAQVEDMAAFFRRHGVRTAFFTSSQTADTFRQRFPHMLVCTLTEGVDLSLYDKGRELADRSIDLLEVGRKQANPFQSPLPEGIRHVKTANFVRAFKSDEEFRAALADTKVTWNVPRCDVDPSVAGGVETLTQRYWECMLSRIVMVGRSPKELTELIGYDPVLPWDGQDASPLVSHVLENPAVYQALVDRNYETARRMASWSIRVEQMMNYLTHIGYQV